MEIVRGGIQNGIQTLSGAAVPGNMASFNQGATYVHPARTADEIKADMAARRQQQPEQTFAEVFAEEAAEHDDIFARLSRTVGLPEEAEEQPNAATHEPNHTDPLPWVF